MGNPDTFKHLENKLNTIVEEFFKQYVKTDQMDTIYTNGKKNISFLNNYSHDLNIQK